MASSILEDEIYESFAGQWLTRADEFYVSKDSAVEFLSRLTNRKIIILGIEGFVLMERSTQPMLSVIADYSRVGANDTQPRQFLQANMAAVTHYHFCLNVD